MELIRLCDNAEQVAAPDMTVFVSGSSPNIAGHRRFDSSSVESLSMEQLRRAETPCRLRIPDDLVPQLRELQSTQELWSELVDSEDVVHLYYGLGPALFLAFDGRIIVDDYCDETGTYEVTDPKEAWKAVAIGASVRSIPELRRLLPERPADASDCPQCKGSGWMWPTEKEPQGSVVCSACGALGWLAPASRTPNDRSG